MSDEVKQEQNSSAPDDLKNLKSEYSRKIDNLQSQLEVLKKTNEDILSYVSANSSRKDKKEPEIDEDFNALFWDDPKKGAKLIQQKAEENAYKRVKAEVDQEKLVESEKNRTLMELGAEFPELNFSGSDLTKEALKLLAPMSASKQNESASLKQAVYQAASYLGLKPVKYRSSEEETFSFGNKHSGEKKAVKEEGKVPPETIELLRRMGYNPADKKISEYLKKATDRKYRTFE